MTDKPHTSVLLSEVVQAINPRDDGVYVDATFGAGGYSRAFLDSANCTVYGIDRDPRAQAIGEALAAEYDGRFTILPGRYSQMAELLGNAGVERVDGIALDIGVSSMQIDDPERGFSFNADGPLDMRMGQSGESAMDVVNTMDEEQLANIIYKYGEERASRAVARIIVETRQEKPITRTAQLAYLVRKVVFRKKGDIDSATRTFQALRIYVNGELDELEAGLSAAETILVPGGRLAVVSFHSLEDRIAKTFLQSRSGRDPKPSRYTPEIMPRESAPPRFNLLKRGAIKPTAEECKINPRSRSARLRAGERTSAPALIVDNNTEMGAAR